MTTSSHDILTVALALPRSDRLDIAEQLWASVKPPGAMSTDDPNSLAELKRRLAQPDAATVDGDEAMRRLWELQRRREGA